MKTAMQELIERYYLFENGEYKPDAFKKHFAEFYPLHLLKEKEQIIDAYMLGFNDSYKYQIQKSNKVTPRNGEEYYNQTYNQKQHIIDIMKADEDDGLYDLNK
jgi:hypothetical protein